MLPFLGIYNGSYLLIISWFSFSIFADKSAYNTGFSDTNTADQNLNVSEEEKMDTEFLKSASLLWSFHACIGKSISVFQIELLARDGVLVTQELDT